MKKIIVLFVFVSLLACCKTKQPCGGVASMEKIIEMNNGVINGDSVKIKN
jgi:hypothetical protein